MSFTNYLENKLIDHIFRGLSYTAPATIYVALHTGDPGETGGSSEVANSNNYSRASLAVSQSNWRGTGGETAGVSTGTGGQTTNGTTITFATPSGSWGTVTHFSLWDSGTYGGGNCLGKGALTTSKVINSGDTVTFQTATLTVTID